MKQARARARLTQVWSWACIALKGWPARMPPPHSRDTDSRCGSLFRPVKYSRELYPLPASLERAQTHWHPLNVDVVAGWLTSLALIAFLPSSLSMLGTPSPSCLSPLHNDACTAWQKPQHLFELPSVPSAPRVCSQLCADTLLKALHSTSSLYLFQALPL